MVEFEDDDLDELAETEPFWTLRRVILTLIIIITLVAFLAYVFLSGWLYTSSRPTPERPTPTQSYQQG
jgi:hypothetical protein